MKLREKYCIYLVKYYTFKVTALGQSQLIILLNQVRAGQRLAHPWFLEIVFVCGHLYVCLRVCVSAPKAINN